MATSAMATVSSPRHPLGLPGVELVEGGCEHLLHVTTQLQTKHSLVTIIISTHIKSVSGPGSKDLLLIVAYIDTQSTFICGTQNI